MNVGISHSDNCVNLACQNKLTDLELKRQNNRSIKHFFCIKCRMKGIPKYGEYVNVKCVHCSDTKKIGKLGDSLICQNCLAKKRKNRHLYNLPDAMEEVVHGM